MHKAHIPVNICVASIIILTPVWYSCTSMYIPRILSRRDGVSSTLTGGRSVVKNSLTIHTLPSLSYTCISCSCVTYLGALTHLACIVWHLPPISSDLVLYQLLHSLFLLPTPPPPLPHPYPTPPPPLPTLPHPSLTLPHPSLSDSSHLSFLSPNLQYFYLEKNRVAYTPPGEGNFNVLYQLLAGADGQLKSDLHLNNIPVEPSEKNLYVEPYTNVRNDWCIPFT